MREEQTIINSTSSVFIATFSHYEEGKRLPTNGFIEQLLSFFLPKVKTILLLDQPHVVSDTIDPYVEFYSHSKLKIRFRISKFLYFPIYILCLLPIRAETRMSYKLRDFFSVLFAAYRYKNTYDLFIGLEGVNALAGIILKKMGKVNTVVYYVSDYSPRRFGKTFFNALYLLLDRFCVKHCDFTWDVSSAMKEARLKVGLDPKYAQKIIHVQNALFPNQIASLPIHLKTPNTAVYMGILQPDMGPDLAISAMSEVVKKIPTAKLHIIGGTRDEVDRLKILARKLSMEKNVIFYGFIKDNKKMAKVVRSCMVGLAPYRSFPDSFRWWGDAGKIRQYLASGLPVVTTHVPPLGRLVTKKGAAIMRKDTVKDFSDGIIQLMTNKDLYKKLSQKAEELSKENTWENTYSYALERMSMLQ